MRGIMPLEDKFGTLQKNGYISKTLKSVNIGQKGRLEWIGDDLCLMDDPKKDKFHYSAVAVTKCVTYQIKLADFNKIPSSVK